MTIFQNGHRNATVWRLVQIEWSVFYDGMVFGVSTCDRCTAWVHLPVAVPSVWALSTHPTFLSTGDTGIIMPLIKSGTDDAKLLCEVLPSSNEQYIRVLEIFLITHCKTYFKNKSLIHYILEKACSSLTTLSHRSI